MSNRPKFDSTADEILSRFMFRQPVMDIAKDLDVSHVHVEDVLRGIIIGSQEWLETQNPFPEEEEK